ncbi:hypothetical protein ACIF9R_24815 [Streptomyces sp. NPDC086080]|uniref:hypothetical protein n=1 Tax=Streptomyces sp. NPDC086080 TaxID=3365748 RepID=UPI0037D6B784
MPRTGSRRSRVTPRGDPYEATQFVFGTFGVQVSATMSNPLSMEDLAVKFHSNRAGVYRGKTTIWQASEGSFYRVVQRLDPAEFEIATLVPTGWIMLLTLHK